MKNILFPTDFSAPAAHAMAQAAAIANQFGSRITLLHAHKVYSTTGALMPVTNYLEEDAHRDLLAQLRILESLLTGEARADSMLANGDATTVIADVARQGNYDLVVMGTKGASGIKEMLLGSITAGVIKETNRPVLAIPEGYEPRVIDNIVLAMDEEGISSPKVTAPLVQISKAFGATIRVFHQDTGAGDIGIDPTVDMYLEGASHSFYYELDEEDVITSISDFVQDVDAEMLCMIRRKRNFLEDVFHSSATTHLVNHTEIPLLVLHDDSRM